MLMDNCCLRFDKCYAKTALVKPSTAAINEHTNAGDLSEVGFHCSSISMLMDNCYLRFDECSSKTTLVKPSTTAVNENPNQVKRHERRKEKRPGILLERLAIAASVVVLG